MNDYINREALLKEIEWQRRASKSAYPRRSFVVGDVLTCISNAPAADVAPVVHGRWEDVFQGGACSWSGKCSACSVRNDIPHPLLAHYCPNCGAWMDSDAQ